jgi:hypothetical protein
MEDENLPNPGRFVLVMGTHAHSDPACMHVRHALAGYRVQRIERSKREGSIERDRKTGGSGIKTPQAKIRPRCRAFGDSLTTGSV